MLTESEKNHLVNEYRREPVSVMGLLLTCAAGLITVIVLALVAIDIHTYSDADTTPQTVTQAP